MFKLAFLIFRYYSGNTHRAGNCYINGYEKVAFIAGFNTFNNNLNLTLNWISNVGPLTILVSENRNNVPKIVLELKGLNWVSRVVLSTDCDGVSIF